MIVSGAGFFGEKGEQTGGCCLVMALDVARLFPVPRIFCPWRLFFLTISSALQDLTHFYTPLIPSCEACLPPFTRVLLLGTTFFCTNIQRHLQCIACVKRP